MKVAVIDCGTNSIRLLIMSTTDRGLVEHDRRLELVRLGQGVDATGEFHPDALARTFAACGRFAAVIAAEQCDRVRFVATSAARDARNREAFFAGVRERLGVEVEVIEGEEEARLSFNGALAGVDVTAEPVLVIDIGGGSTEHVVGSASGRIDFATSLDIGSVRVRERFLVSDPPTDAEEAQARGFVGALLDASGVDFASIRTFIGVAGTVTSLSAIHQGLTTYDRHAVHGSVLTVTDVDALTRRLLASTIADVEATTCLPLKRAEVICAGALIADEIATRVGTPMIVSESDILDGMAHELLAR
ncbi:MAG TPA: Ppx/GppA phosphatase family protein [Propionibacteriaceae bacterium]|nr:Ppx/GppA phosphatase family protein [Propionibacteriaceae bacterium]